MNFRMPLEEVVSLAMRGVSEVKNVTIPADENRTLSTFGTWGMGEGKTVAKRKKNRGIIEADANVSRPQIYPEWEAANTFRKPLLTVQIDTVTEKIPKYRLVKSLGLLAQTTIPSNKFATAARSKSKRFARITVIRLW